MDGFRSHHSMFWAALGADLTVICITELRQALLGASCLACPGVVGLLSNLSRTANSLDLPNMHEIDVSRPAPLHLAAARSSCPVRLQHVAGGDAPGVAGTGLGARGSTEERGGGDTPSPPPALHWLIRYPPACYHQGHVVTLLGVLRGAALHRVTQGDACGPLRGWQCCAESALRSELQHAAAATAIPMVASNQARARTTLPALKSNGGHAHAAAATLLRQRTCSSSSSLAISSTATAWHDHSPLRHARACGRCAELWLTPPTLYGSCFRPML
jgi:hypothetical protein